ncbi:hypothetical protein K4F52_002408 [Lecanicillium sp. MT-2017a]|nr:hypothetical protein K4F52_002408 [Lecanicillium sp. MT-2017a]
MDRWKQAISAAKLQSILNSMGRPEYGEDGLDPGFHPEELGAVDDIQQGPTQAGTDENDNSEAEKANPETLRDAQDQEAADIVRAFGLHSSPQPAKARKDAEAPITGATTPDTITDVSMTSENGLGHSAAGPAGAGLLSTLLRMSQLENGLVNKEYFLNKEYLNDENQEKRAKWYEQPDGKGSASSSMPKLSALVNAAQPRRRKRKQKEQAKLTVHVASILSRQRYIMQLCRAFMAYGAPTHRLEQYMVMTANILEVSAQFLYMPGCMVMSFDDTTTHTAQVKLVRSVQGIDLGRLTETHNIYKNVVHDKMSAEEAAQELDRIMKRSPRYNKPFIILLYGFSSACIGPWAFDARPIDLPIIFFLGSLVGFMQHVVAPYSVLFANVFEVAMAIITSFLARAFGSIPARGMFANDEGRKYIFCFSSIAQSSICMILPGFAVLCSSLELQSHQIIAGSVRLVYTILYSLFLGYGVTIGTTVYGLIDDNATYERKCYFPPDEPYHPYGNKYIQHFPFVAVYCILAALVNQAKFRQTPIMAVFGLVGYMPNFFLSNRLGSSTGLANTVGAFALGTAGNLYSRIWHGHAASAIIPGIFTIVSSGLAATGAIISGLEYSRDIKNGTINDSTVINSNNSLTGLGYGMIEVAIGVSVGLFISAVVVYPYGKQRSGLFSF